LQGFFKYSISF